MKISDCCKKTRHVLTRIAQVGEHTHKHSNTGLLAWHKLAHRPGNWSLDTLHSSTGPTNGERMNEGRVSWHMNREAAKDLPGRQCRVQHQRDKVLT